MFDCLRNDNSNPLAGAIDRGYSGAAFSAPKLRRIALVMVTLCLAGCGATSAAQSNSRSRTTRDSDQGSDSRATQARPQAIEPTAGAQAAATTGAATASTPHMPPRTQTTTTSDPRQIAPIAGLRANAQASFARLQDRLEGEARISIAVEPLGVGPVQILGGNPAMQGMSTTKILILSALLRDKDGVHNFTPEQTLLARAAITLSDNSAILALFSDLEADKGGLLRASAYATSLLRSVGDDQTQVSTAPPPAGYATTFGQTPWTPTAEVRFFRALALDCVLPRADTDFELELMRDIEPSESFGLGSAGFPQVAFKGGWGPEPENQYGVRQTGIIGAGDSGLVVSLVADPVSTFAVGQSVLDQVAQWLRREVRLTPRLAGGCPA